MWQGTVVSIQVAPDAAAPMVTLESVEAVAGKGLAGDRYFHRAGTYSERPGSGRQVTLIEAEAIEAMAREAGLDLAPAACRSTTSSAGGSGWATWSWKGPGSASRASTWSR